MELIRLENQRAQQEPEFTVEAIEKGSGALIATQRFRVVRHWPNNELGPPMAVTGARQVYRKPGWGGGPAGPQNITAWSELPARHASS